MKVLIIASEFPYPANHGAKVDIWNRIMAFKKLQVEVFLISWYPGNEAPLESHIDIVLKYVKKIKVFPVHKNLDRIIKLISYPSQVAARLLTSDEFDKTFDEVSAFNPDFVFVDSIYGGATGLKFSKRLSIPLTLRLHNIEHKYMLGQLKLASGLKAKLSLLAMNLHLKKFEHGLIKKSDSFFDISLTDLDYWTKHGFLNGHWLPPIIDVESALDHKEPVTQKKYHVAFIGNLYTPNNVDGLKWFVKNVLPLLKEAIAGFKFAIIGSNPNIDVIKIAEKYEYVDLFANVADTQEYIQMSEVLINPVGFSSGVNIKAINMLALDNEVVSTSDGVKGLPEQISEVFFIADNPTEFANHILNILTFGKKTDIEKRKEMRALFSPSSLKSLLPVMLNKKEI